MDVVTIAMAIAAGATLASLSSVLLNIIKDVLKGQSNEAQVIIKLRSKRQQRYNSESLACEVSLEGMTKKNCSL